MRRVPIGALHTSPRTSVAAGMNQHDLMALVYGLVGLLAAGLILCATAVLVVKVFRR